jgi:hypothetical protein
LGAWQAPDPQPQQSRFVLPLRVDNPPFNSRSNQPPAQPDAWFSLQRTFTPPAQAQTLAPQWLSTVLGTWQPPDPQPQLPRFVLPLRVDNPPFSQRRQQPPPPDDVTIVLPRLLVPQQTAAAAAQTLAPSSLPIILIGWQPADPLPTLPRLLNPSITAVESDNPPFGPSSASFDWWIAPDQLFTAVKLPPPTPVPAQTLAPPWLSIVLSAWEPPPPQPQTALPLNPSITAVEVDNPPIWYGGPIANPALIVGLSQPDAWPFTFEAGAQPYAPRVAQPVSGATPVPPPVVIPPAGGGKRRKPIQPIWDRQGPFGAPAPEPVPAPRHDPAAPKLDPPSAARQLTKRELKGLAAALGAGHPLVATAKAAKKARVSLAEEEVFLIRLILAGEI